MNPTELYSLQAQALAFVRGLGSFSPRAAVAVEGLRRYDNPTITATLDAHQRDHYMNVVRQRGSFSSICDLLVEPRSSEVQDALTDELATRYDAAVRHVVERTSEELIKRWYDDLNEAPPSEVSELVAGAFCTFDDPSYQNVDAVFGDIPTMRTRARALIGKGSTITSEAARERLEHIAQVMSCQDYGDISRNYVAQRK